MGALMRWQLRVWMAVCLQGIIAAIGIGGMAERALASDPRQAIVMGSDWSRPMKFSIVHNNRIFADEIFAVGEIGDTTLQAFTDFLDNTHAGPGTKIILHSPGGNAQAGIDMGRLIRQRSMDTVVGQAHRPTTRQSVDQLVLNIDPAECDSSCSLAFLGGVRRRVPTGSLYGVHDLCRVARPQEHGSPDDLFAEGQQDAAVVNSYVAEMGIEADFLMAFASKNSCKNEIFYVPANAMSQMHITTLRLDTKWGIKVVEAEFYLSGAKPGSSYFPGEHNELNFACHGQPRQVLLQAFFLPPTVDREGQRTFTPPIFASSIKALRLATTKQAVSGPNEDPFDIIAVDPGEIYAPIVASGRFHISLFLTATPRIRAFIDKANDLSFRFHVDDKTYYGFSVDVGSAHDRIAEFIAACK